MKVKELLEQAKEESLIAKKCEAKRLIRTALAYVGDGSKNTEAWQKYLDNLLETEVANINNRNLTEELNRLLTLNED